MHKRAATLSSSIPRQTKRRRRTATAVLAGHFDPRPQRDFFTDMANSSDSQSPYNSIVGHGPGILFDIRSQEEKDSEAAREQKRLFKNAKRKERDIEKRRDKEEQKLKKAQKRVERIRDTAQVKSVHRTEGSHQVAPTTGTNAISPPTTGDETVPPISFTRGGVNHAPREPPLGLSHLQTGPCSGWSPYYPAASGVGSSSSQRPLTYEGRTAASPAEFLQSGPLPRTGASLAPAVPLVTISVPPPPPALLPASPPTPSRSISSITSRTSSKRPRTPDDDEVTPAHMHNHDHDHDTFEAYSSMDVDQEEHILEQTSVGGIPRDKVPFRAPSPCHEVSECEPRTPTDPGFSVRGSYDSPAWFQPQSPQSDMQPGGPSSYSPWGPAYSIPSSSIAPNRGSPMPDNPTVPSIAHRRSALSLAALLSPSSVPYVSPRSIPPVPSIPEIPVASETCISELPQDDTSVGMVADQLPEPSIAASSTVDSSCLSPMAVASPLTGEAPFPANDSLHQVIDKIIVVPPDETRIASLDVAINEIAESTTEATAPQFIGLGPPIELTSPLDRMANVYNSLNEREESATPELDRKDQGRASKAMLVIHSEDELTDIEDFEATLHSKSVVKRGIDVTGPASKVPVGSVGASSENNVPGDDFHYPESSASPAVSVVGVAPKRRKRPAAKKGWKGWVEVEIDGERVPPKRFTLDILPPGERRTRSGKQFDG